MFIAVISDVYVEIQGEHENYWERHIIEIIARDVVKSDNPLTTTGELLSLVFSYLYFRLGLDRIFRLIRNKIETVRKRRKAKEALNQQETDGDFLSSSMDSEIEIIDPKRNGRQQRHRTRLGYKFSVKDIDRLATDYFKKTQRKEDDVLLEIKKLKKQLKTLQSSQT
jgi:hypothetical protein